MHLIQSILLVISLFCNLCFGNLIPRQDSPSLSDCTLTRKCTITFGVGYYCLANTCTGAGVGSKCTSELGCLGQELGKTSCQQGICVDNPSCTSNDDCSSLPEAGYYCNTTTSLCAAARTGIACTTDIGCASLYREKLECVDGICERKKGSLGDSCKDMSQCNENLVCKVGQCYDIEQAVPEGGFCEKDVECQGQPLGIFACQDNKCTRVANSKSPAKATAIDEFRRGNIPRNWWYGPESPSSLTESSSSLTESSSSLTESPSSLTESPSSLTESPSSLTKTCSSTTEISTLTPTPSYGPQPTETPYTSITSSDEPSTQPTESCTSITSLDESSTQPTETPCTSVTSLDEPSIQPTDTPTPTPTPTYGSEHIETSSTLSDESQPTSTSTPTPTPTPTPTYGSEFTIPTELQPTSTPTSTHEQGPTDKYQSGSSSINILTQEKRKKALRSKGRARRRQIVK